MEVSNGWHAEVRKKTQLDEPDTAISSFNILEFMFRKMPLQLFPTATWRLIFYKVQLESYHKSSGKLTLMSNERWLQRQGPVC
jgi:hypothetical protein